MASTEKKTVSQKIDDIRRIVDSLSHQIGDIDSPRGYMILTATMALNDFVHATGVLRDRAKTLADDAASVQKDIEMGFAPDFGAIEQRRLDIESHTTMRSVAIATIRVALQSLKMMGVDGLNSYNLNNNDFLTADR
jgi:hypothetical protein